MTVLANFRAAQANAKTPPAAKLPWDFAIEVFETLPDLPPPWRSVRQIPFRDRWTEIAEAIAGDGKPRGFTVPASYFVEERGIDAQRVTHAYIRQKLSDEWAKWLKDEPGRKECFALIRLNATEEDGVSPAVQAIVKPLGNPS